ncbi:MAG TPA: S1/P1 nuclease [Fimbriimonadaceae bacterium]|nr:S1/P1 nuclease [Fimbriimonadaceae bacterium]HRJ97025.1 S1/P1 nuclease [Fimbriimonadaceae bacterium]
MRAFLTFSAVLIAAAGHGWIETGHMVVAAIAEKGLNARAKARVSELVKIGTDDRTNTFVTCGVWADDVKSSKDRDWHYINIFFRRDGKPADMEPPEENVVWAIRRFTKVLGDAKASRDDRAEALRYLVHFVGDVHQPLHAVSEVSTAWPSGDRGGNDFNIGPVSGWSERPLTNLHALWDFGCGAFLPVRRPLNAKGKDRIDQLATEIMKEVPRAKLSGLAERDPMKWARESHELAKREAYSLQRGRPVPETYLSKGRATCRRQAALAGHRLADLLNRVLGS